MKLPSYPWRFAHLAALWGYGVSQPVFSLLKGNPEFLVITGASRLDTISFALVLAFVPPLLAVALEAIAGRVSSKLDALLHVIAVWLFGFTAAVQLLARFDPSATWTLLVPAVLAYVGAIAYSRWSLVRSFLSISVALPVIGLLTFVFSAPLAVANAQGANIDVAARTPVVVVVFDEFALSSLMAADGSIDATRFPGFGRLSKQSTWYSRATSVYDHTTQAVPAILSGERPRAGYFPTLADFPRNLFTLLGERYAFHVVEPVTRLCPVRYCPDHRSSDSLPIRVSKLLHDVGIDYLYGAMPADMRGNTFPLREGWNTLVENDEVKGDGFLDMMSPTNAARSLYFLHVLQPHAPWALLPSGRNYNDPSVLSAITEDWEPGKYEHWRDNDLLVQQAYQRQLLQVVAVDHFVSRMIARLRATGLWDRALVVVTADHGVSFRANGWRRHVMPSNLSDIASVPLFVKYPTQTQGREDRRAAETIDVLPTIADVLGIKLPWKVDGRSLRAAPIERLVQVGRYGGPAVVARPSAVSAALLATARRNAAWLGNGDDSLYRIGPRRELLGRPVESFARTSSDADVWVAHLSELEDVHKESGYVPVHVLAQLSWKTLRPAEDVAVAVNGRLAAVTRPYLTRGDTWIDAMVDEDLLRDGRNSVGIYAVRGTRGSPRLVLLGGNVARSPPGATVAAARKADGHGGAWR
jgi:hypothetical protein